MRWLYSLFRGYTTWRYCEYIWEHSTRAKTVCCEIPVIQWNGVGISRLHTTAYHWHKDSADTYNSNSKLKAEFKMDYNLRSFEDQLFDTLCDSEKMVAVQKFIQLLTSTGLRKTDPRLQESMKKFAAVQDAYADTENRLTAAVDRETFKECIKDNLFVISKAFRNEFVIPDFMELEKDIDEIYWNCKPNNEGKVATYIPQLSRYSPSRWGVSLCTTDGQRHGIGDTDVTFTLQSTSKPLAYALALTEHGQDVVHQYVGQEPSGHLFNEIKLDAQGKPHNPLINAGAIVIASLIKNNISIADRFDYVQDQFRRVAGDDYLGFNNSVFLSERQHADRNFALGYYLKEHKCFPEGTDLMETMDFYFQMCSIEGTTDSLSVMAATLANGGICPINGDRVFNPVAVRNTLSVMHSCGMYDYSGQFAFQVGLPAKSGVSGAIMLVVPNVMGMCCWSPLLDRMGNSQRGLQFCTELVKKFNFHNYDNLKHIIKKKDPRRRRIDRQGAAIHSLLFAAYNGDISAMRRFKLSGMNMDKTDYDLRTPLHIAAAEGHADVVRFLLEKCEVSSCPKDRWGHTPLSDADLFNHAEIVDLLKEYEDKSNSTQENNDA